MDILLNIYTINLNTIQLKNLVMPVKKSRTTITHFYNYALKIIVPLFKLVLGCFHYVHIETSTRKFKIISYY